MGPFFLIFELDTNIFSDLGTETNTKTTHVPNSLIYAGYIGVGEKEISGS